MQPLLVDIVHMEQLREALVSSSSSSGSSDEEGDAGGRGRGRTGARCVAAQAGPGRGGGGEHQRHASVASMEESRQASLAEGEAGAEEETGRLPPSSGEVAPLFCIRYMACSMSACATSLSHPFLC